MAASGAAAGELRSRETSKPRAVRALQSSSPAALAESRVARQNRMPTPTRCNRTRRARHVPPAICSRSPQTCGGPRDPPATPTDGDWANPPNKGANCCSANYCCGRCGSHGQRRPAERRARRAPPPLCGRTCWLTREVGWPTGSSRFAGRLRQGRAVGRGHEPAMTATSSLHALATRVLFGAGMFPPMPPGELPLLLSLWPSAQAYASRCSLPNRLASSRRG